MKINGTVVAILALVPMAPVYAATVPAAPAVNHWSQVGANPCNGRCTARTMLDYLAAHEEWPPEAIAYFRERYSQAEVMLHLGYAPKDIPWTQMDVAKDWSGVGSHGDNHLTPNTRASLPADAKAYGWSYVDERGVTYRLRYVDECANLVADSGRLVLPVYYTWGNQSFGDMVHDNTEGDQRHYRWGPGSGYIGGGGGGIPQEPDEIIVISPDPDDTCHCDKPSNDESMAVIPLPAALPHLLTALAALTCLRRLRRRIY